MKYIILGVEDEDFKQMEQESKWIVEGGMRGLNPYGFEARKLKSIGDNNTEDCLIANVVSNKAIFENVEKQRLGKGHKKLFTYQRSNSFKKEVLLGVEAKLHEWIEELEK